MLAVLLPWAEKTFVCPRCRRTWERMQQTMPEGRERAVANDGHITHRRADTYFTCCGVPFKWMAGLSGPPPTPDDQPMEGHPP